MRLGGFHLEINTQLHTIYLLVGPIECGKSTFIQKVLLPQLQFDDKNKGFKADIQVISPEKISKELRANDDELNAYDQISLEANLQLIELLDRQLNLVTSFPVNAEFVVVDATGLLADFRKKIRHIARANQYHVEVIVFDYVDQNYYFTNECSQKLISNQLSYLRKVVLPLLAQEKYNAIHTIKKKDFLKNQKYQIKIENKKTFLSTLLLQKQEYAIIGDVHECVEELQALIQKFDFDIQDGCVMLTEKSKNKKLIFVGDWIDKGKQTGEIVNFMYRNKAHFLLTLGNHESFVYKYLRGEINNANQHTVNNYFTSIPYLRENDDVRAKFNHLVEISQPFFKYLGVDDTRKPFYVTHSPCKNKYLGKLDSHSLRQQRKFKLIREEETQSQIKFIEKEADVNHPFHFFGHVAAQEPFKLGNKVHLDTGCAHGNKLVGVEVNNTLYFKSQKSKTHQLDKKLPLLFKESDKHYDKDEDLELNVLICDIT